MQLTTGTQQEDLEVMKAIEDLRSQHARNRIELEQVNTNKLRFEGPLSCLNAHHARRNNNLYAFRGVGKRNSELS